MRKTTAAAALAATLIAGGGAALLTPGLALAASDTATSATSGAAGRLSAITDALKGLVSNGTLDQAQADQVASTLSQADLGPGGHGRHGGPGGGRLSPDATAKVLGITVDQLRTAQEAGQTLAQIAQAHGVSRADLVSGLVAAAQAQLAADVTAGRLTQAQADQQRSTLTARITAGVDQVGPGGRHGDRDGDGPDGAAGAPTTPSTPSPAPSASSSS